MRDLEEIMLEEQALAAADEEAAANAVVPATAAANVMQIQAGPSDTADIVEQLQGASEVMDAAVNKNDAMELVSSAELVDLFSEYYESDKIDMDFLTNDKSCNGDIDFEHAAFTNPGVAAAVPTNTRAELGSNTEDYDIDNMISYD